jgi:CheY-like chemotaxis protein
LGRSGDIVEPHPAVQAVLEHLLIREGYAVEAFGEASEAAPEQLLFPTLPVLLLVGAENGDGLYVFRTRDVAGVLAALDGDSEPSEGDLSIEFNLSAFGIHAFVPKPFGILDIVQIVHEVGDFDERRKGARRGATEGSPREESCRRRF